MSSQVVIDAVEAKVQQLFPNNRIRVLLNEQKPEPPRDFSTLTEGWFGLEFPEASETLRSLGDAGNNNWTENGVFIVHIIVASGIGPKLANERDEIIKQAFRSQQIGENNEITVLDIFQAAGGDMFGGNWFVLSRGFGYERDFHG